MYVRECARCKIRKRESVGDMRRKKVMAAYKALLYLDKKQNKTKLDGRKGSESGHVVYIM